MNEETAGAFKDSMRLLFERFGIQEHLDTYDPVRGTRRAAQRAGELQVAGIILEGVRIDSGDLADEARRVRDILVAEGVHPR